MRWSKLNCTGRQGAVFQAGRTEHRSSAAWLAQSVCHTVTHGRSESSAQQWWWYGSHDGGLRDSWSEVCISELESSWLCRGT